MSDPFFHRESTKVEAASRRFTMRGGRGRARSRRSVSAFTLIELLVVIAIVLLLIGLIVPAVNTIKEEAKKKKTKALLLAIETTFQSYYTEYDRWPGQDPPPQDPPPVNNNNEFEDPMSGKQWTNSSQVGWVMGWLRPDHGKNFKDIAFWVDDTRVTDPWGDVIHVTITNDRVYCSSVNL